MVTSNHGSFSWAFVSISGRFFPVDAARMNVFFLGGEGYVANTSLTLKL